MIYQIQRITRDVRIAIDENKMSEQLITDEDIDTLSLDEIVRSKIVEAVRRVITKAPVHLLDGGEPFGDSIYWRDNLSGWTLLPTDFLRLIVFKMSDWERAVYEPITPADAAYGQQSSRYGGLRGNPQRPVVAIVRRPEGLALELYSCRSEEATVEQGIYYPLPYMDRDGGIDIPERCYESAVYEAAALTMATIGQADMATLLEGKGNELLI